MLAALQVVFAGWQTQNCVSAQHVHKEVGVRHVRCFILRRPIVGVAVFANRSFIMLSWALTFLVIALIALALGFSGVAGAATSIAKILAVAFLVLFVISLVFPRFRRTL
jgi:uncharacterized membrane protein YtjA (UPF0391 family)